jgi:hypothetical protein
MDRGNSYSKMQQIRYALGKKTIWSLEMQRQFAENQKTRLSYGNFLGKPGKKLIAMGSTICSFYYKLYYKFSKRADTKNSY